MSLWVVVPVRSLRDGKRRLGPALDDVQRSAFIEWLLARTLEEAAEFPGLKRTLVVSTCPDARARASTRGAQVLEERVPGGLNGALRQAHSAVRSLGASRMLVVPCDLPLLRAEDLQRCARAASATTIAIAPDRSRTGTNGLCLPTCLTFDFSFGPDSFERHLDGARQLNMRSAIVERAGLAFDVDLPVHLSELRPLIPGLQHGALPWLDHETGARRG